MARIAGGIAAKASGKLGPVVVVQRGETSYIRTAPVYTKHSWTPAQLKHRERFKRVSAFVQTCQHNVIVPIWNKIARYKSGRNLFLKANMAAFDSDGLLADRSLLHFSEGILALPFHLALSKTADEPLTFSVSWQTDSLSNMKTVNDELMAVVALDGRFTAPQPLGLQRASGGGTLVLNEKADEVKGIYLFFATAHRKSFSPDRYFSLE